MIVFSFSPTCHLDNGGEVICDKCLPGYAGTKCERYENGKLEITRKIYLATYL